MEIANKINKEKLIKSSNKKTFIYKSPSFNKSSNKSKHNNEIINFKHSNYKEKIIHNNLKKYNISTKTFNKYIINDIIFDHRNHIVAVFKNYLLWDESSEFLKRYYKKKDIFGRLPKISEYYEQYTLFSPNYLANEGLLIIIMIKWIKKKKKYMQYLEEKEEAEKNKKVKKNLNQNFEPLISEEILSLTKNRSKSFFSSCIDLSKNTLELTTFDNDFDYNKRKKSENKIYKEQNNNEFDNEEFKNSVSFTEIIDDLSSHFSVLINKNNNYKDYKIKEKPIKNCETKKIISKNDINIKNNTKKSNTKQIKQKCLTKKPSLNKQQMLMKKEKEILPTKMKEIHKINKVQKKTNTKKSVLSKDKNKIEKIKEKVNDNKDNNKIQPNSKDVKRFQKVTIININLKENKDINNNTKNNEVQLNKMNVKNISILNSNSGKNKKEVKVYNENLNIINTIANINPQYYSISKLINNNKQSSSKKKINMKSLNLINFNPNIIPDLKKLVSKQKDKKIIFPRNFNLIYKILIN